MTINLPDPRFDAFWKMRQGEVDELLARIDALQRTNADLLAQLASATALGDRLWRDVEALQSANSELLDRNEKLRLWAQDEQAKRNEADDARVQARSELAYAQVVVEAARNVVKAQADYHLRRNWPVGVPLLASALAALDQAPSESAGKWSGTYEDLGDAELTPEEHAEAQRQITQADRESVRMAQHTGSDPT